MKYRFLYFALSGVLITIGVFSLVKWGLNLSIDFTGGTVVEYERQDSSRFIERYGVITQEEAQKKDSKIVRFETVGPTLSAEILKKTAVALAIAAAGILLWVAWQFKSLQFGLSAILAMLHDSFILIGAFALFGHLYNASVDTLFVTALLTTLAFSVHDTIVVFDRVREMKRRTNQDLYSLANLAISQTLVRSLNNSLTIIFVLVALVLLGGSTLFWFSMALLIGTITGTYSSPFVAVPLLVSWEELRKRLRRRVLL